jgi:hypothetical protein
MHADVSAHRDSEAKPGLLIRGGAGGVTGGNPTGGRSGDFERVEHRRATATCYLATTGPRPHEGAWIAGSGRDPLHPT